MTKAFGLEIEKSLDEVYSIQKKFLKGIDIMLNLSNTESDITPKDLVYHEDKMSLFHYRPVVKNPCPVPTLIVYALVNRQYMMDIQQDRSMIKSLLEQGLDVYIIDWGYPGPEDRYVTMEDYIDGYVDNCVNIILKETGKEKLNLIGVCQGGTFSAIYTALHKQKIKNLVTMVTPIDFDTKDGLLFVWGKHLNIDNIVDAYGVVPGSFMNAGYNLLKPFQLLLDKYVGLFNNLDQQEVVENFVRMEKWIYDSPGQAGETLRQFIKDLYQDNKLAKGEFELGGRKVDLKEIDMPLLNIFAEYDHLVPPSSSKPLNDLVSSKDKEMISFPVGHIGMYVSSRSQVEIAPKLGSWLLEHSADSKDIKPKGKK